ncbi:MAG: phosphoribosylamine--glycine ligase [Candidatus Micrarchaeota archaeon]|nr:phosphoribosylamine--glycine ligase [Candidatus Micrarchaeota archaeon]
MDSFLLVGNGAREHAIAKGICRNRKVRLLAFMSANNPGIAELVKKSGGQMKIGDIHSPREVSEFAKKHKPDLCFPSPDAVLAAGVVDALQSEGFACAAPTKEAARLEWDKSYCRQLLKDFKIPGSPKFGIFQDAKQAASFIDFLGGQVAVKPAGLTGGKGVKVVGFQLEDASQAKQYAMQLLAARHGGLGSIVIEERLEGEEFSLQAFCDGKRVFCMPLVQDHKRAYEGDVGPNTGGMGSYSDANHLLPFLRPRHRDSALEIMQKTIEAFHKKTKNRFVGVLYGGFMATRDGVKLIEYNCRFGDPEAMNVLSILGSDLYDVLLQISESKLRKAPKFEKKATVCKYLVPEGYPEKSIADQPLSIDYSAIAQSRADLFYASVYEKGGVIYTQSSRSIGLVGIADDIEKAEEIAEKACGAVKGRVWHRRDIGTPSLVQRRIEHMRRLGAL